MVAQPGLNRVKLKLPKDCKAFHTFHINRVKLWTDPALMKMRKGSVKLPEVMFEEGTEMEVSKILDDDYLYGKHWYLVQWKGYGMKDATWQELEQMKGCETLIRKYNVEHGIVLAAGSKAKRKRKRRSKS